MGGAAWLGTEATPCSGSADWFRPGTFPGADFALGWERPWVRPGSEEESRAWAGGRRRGGGRDGLWGFGGTVALLPLG